jgi:phage terminase large subunit-like protein
VITEGNVQGEERRAAECAPYLAPAYLDEEWLKGFWVDLGKALKLEIKEHPVFRLPGLEQVRTALGTEAGKRELIGALGQRAKAIGRMESDPLRYGAELPMWGDADELLRPRNEILVMGGNRSSKTEWAAKRMVQLLVKKPGAIVWFLHTTSDTSIRYQQPVVWRYLPPEWKTAKKDRVTNVQYSVKNGFSDGVFVLPNGSIGVFMNYKQDRDVIEGGQVDAWWCDELVPVDWVHTLRSRYVDRAGKGVITFTPIRGYTPTVAEYLAAAAVKRWAESELLPDTVNFQKGPKGKVPYVQQCVNPMAAVIYFQSCQNPFTNYAKLVETFAGKSSAYILERAHGVATRLAGLVLAKFGAHNIIPPERVPKEGTNYQVIDFAWARPWAMIWIRVWQYKGKKRFYVYRDWPDAQTYGEWATTSEKPDGERGPAQVLQGLGVKAYKRLMLKLEGHRRPGSTPVEGQPEPEVIFRRIGDPRSGRAEAVVDDGGTCLIDMMAEEQSDDEGVVPSMIVEPASGRTLIDLREGINLINEMLEYDEGKPIDLDNEPQFYVSSACRQVIDCLRMWTGQDGQKGASKDFIDLLRYAAQMGLEDVGAMELGSRGGGGY